MTMMSLKRWFEWRCEALQLKLHADLWLLSAEHRDKEKFEEVSAGPAAEFGYEFDALLAEYSARVQQIAKPQEPGAGRTINEQMELCVEHGVWTESELWGLGEK